MVGDMVLICDPFLCCYDDLIKFYLVSCVVKYTINYVIEIHLSYMYLHEA